VAEARVHEYALLERGMSLEKREKRKKKLRGTKANWDWGTLGTGPAASETCDTDPKKGIREVHNKSPGEKGDNSRSKVGDPRNGYLPPRMALSIFPNIIKKNLRKRGENYLRGNRSKR